MVHYLSSPPWPFPKKTPALALLQNSPGELQNSVMFPLPSLPKTTIPAFTTASWSLQAPSVSEVSPELHPEKDRFQNACPQTLPLLPIASHCIPLHSTALPLPPTVFQMARWAHLNKPVPGTGGAQWCWGSTVLHSQCSSSLQERGKFFLSGERQKMKASFKGDRKEVQKTKSRAASTQPSGRKWSMSA